MLEIAYLVSFLISAATAFSLARYLARANPAPDAWPLFILAVAAAFWSLTYVLELLSTNLETAMFWAQVEYLAIVTLAPAWLVFALQYTGRDNWFSRRPWRLALLMIVPLVTLILVRTNGMHGLFWRQVVFRISDSQRLLHLTYGPAFWVHWVYAYTLLAIGSIWLAAMLLRAPHLQRQQVFLALFGVAVPWLSNLLYVLRLYPLPDIDLTPLAFAAAGLAFWLSLYRYRLLDIVPVAHQVLIDNLDDAVFVLDQQTCLADMNQAAEQFTDSRRAAAIGRPLEDVLTRT